VRWAASGWPPTGAVVIACDVGQGDAIVLPTAAHEAVVVDAGPDPVAVDGCLRRLGVSVVPALVITHFHVDHVAGISGVLRDRVVGEVVVPRFTEPEAGRRGVEAAGAAAGIPVTTADVGWSLIRGQTQLRVIGPAQTLTGTRSDPNNNSLLLFVVSHGVSVLLVGDAENEEQDALLRDAGATVREVDVLKVAHHGSLYQDPALLDAADPVVALVSVGAGNPYGHPNPAVLDRLARQGARVLRTDLDGDVAVVEQAGGVAVAVRGGADRTGHR
jgi:competence protein ComEC